MKKVLTNVLAASLIASLTSQVRASMLPPVTAALHTAVVGHVEYKDLQSRVLAVHVDEYGALVNVKVTPGTVIFVNGRPSSLDHLFINDRVQYLRYDKETNELREVQLKR